MMPITGYKLAGQEVNLAWRWSEVEIAIRDMTKHDLTLCFKSGLRYTMTSLKPEIADRIMASWHEYLDELAEEDEPK
jgi:hypothetical protein